MVAYTNYATDARVRREAETLAAHGLDVLCLTTMEGTSPAKITLNGVQVRELRVPKYRGKSTVAYMLSYVRFLVHASIVCVKLMLQGRLDIVHAHNLPDFLALAGLVPRLMRRRVVLDIHDSMPETFATKFGSSSVLHKALCWEERISAMVAHRVICVNTPQRDTLVGRGIPAEKAFISMNVPDPRIFRPQSGARSTPTQEGVFNLVYHGTMATRLGVDLLIQAVNRLRNRIPGVRLHLWGNGDDLSRFQALTRELNADQLVLFRPQGFALDELPARLQAMHVGVIGNRRTVAGELMLPVKLLEYIALGIPVVAPRLRTIQHYLQDSAVYYDPEDIDSMADCIENVHRQPNLAACRAAKASAFLELHGWHRQGAELVAMYQELVEKKAI